MTKWMVGLFALFFSVYGEARLNPGVSALSVSQMRGVQINTHDATNCFPPRLVEAIDELRTRFGRVSIRSANRSVRHNRQVGGARGSQHVGCNAIDFEVPGVPRAEIRQFLIANFMGRGGVAFYCASEGKYFHLDMGRPRQWGRCQPSTREISQARQRYSRYLAQRNRQRQNQSVRSANYTPANRRRNPSHGGLHRHQGDSRIFHGVSL